MQFSLAIPAQGSTNQLPSMPPGLDSAALAQLAANLKKIKPKPRWRLSQRMPLTRSDCLKKSLGLNLV